MSTTTLHNTRPQPHPSLRGANVVSNAAIWLGPNDCTVAVLSPPPTPFGPSEIATPRLHSSRNDVLFLDKDKLDTLFWAALFLRDFIQRVIGLAVPESLAVFSLHTGCVQLVDIAFAKTRDHQAYTFLIRPQGH